MVNHYSTSNHIKFVSEQVMNWFRKSETRKEWKNYILNECAHPEKNPHFIKLTKKKNQHDYLTQALIQQQKLYQGL